MPLADLITPNLPEAASLLDEAPAADENGAAAQARRLVAAGAHGVLIKGGHAAGDESVDHLLTSEGLVRRFSGARHPTRNTHGTGCTLSAAVAAGLAKGLGLEAAVRAAKAYVAAAIAAADDLAIGEGHGPVHHFFAIWA
jgi:hydroxymethylpyrimidine/phosphomethylpyrimidine kinase